MDVIFFSSFLGNWGHGMLPYLTEFSSTYIKLDTVFRPRFSSEESLLALPKAQGSTRTEQRGRGGIDPVLSWKQQAFQGSAVKGCLYTGFLSGHLLVSAGTEWAKEALPTLPSA